MSEEAKRRLEEYEKSLDKLRELKIRNISELWIEYDRQNDILYISFGREEADESIMLDEDIVVLIRGETLVGIVINNFSQRT